MSTPNNLVNGDTIGEYITFKQEAEIIIPT